MMGRVARLTGSIVEESMYKSHSLLPSLLPQFSSIAVGENKGTETWKGREPRNRCRHGAHFCPQHLQIDRQTDWKQT